MKPRVTVFGEGLLLDSWCRFRYAPKCPKVSLFHVPRAPYAFIFIDGEILTTNKVMGVFFSHVLCVNYRGRLHVGHTSTVGLDCAAPPRTRVVEFTTREDVS